MMREMVQHCVDILLTVDFWNIPPCSARSLALGCVSALLWFGVGACAIVWSVYVCVCVLAFVRMRAYVFRVCVRACLCVWLRWCFVLNVCACACVVCLRACVCVCLSCTDPKSSPTTHFVAPVWLTRAKLLWWALSDGHGHADILATGDI